MRSDGPWRMKTGAYNTAESYQYQFCALEYRPQRWNMASSHKAPVVLLVLRREDGSLRILIHTELSAIVQREDSPYIEELLRDFLGRAKEHSAELFKQISSLGVGPLVTSEVGTNFSEHTALIKLLPRF